MRVVKANPGESIYSFIERLEEMRGNGEIVTGEFNFVTFTVPEEGDVWTEYAEQKRRAEEEFEKHQAQRRAEKKEEAGRKITKLCQNFVDRNSGRTDLDESEIMRLLGVIGQCNYYDDQLDIDPDATRRLIELLEQNGYKPRPANAQYRIGRDSWDGGRNNFVVGNSFIVCENGEDLSQFDSSQLARFAIENAMAQLSIGRPLYANYDFEYMYGRLKENERVVEALSYSMASDLHEAWRETRRREDGTYEPRMKKSKDERWNQEHGTDDVDIANLSFDELPSNWQFENLEAARVAVGLVFDEVARHGSILYARRRIEEMSARVHDAWLGRNDWVFDPETGKPELARPYEELSDEEKEKDRAQIMQAIEKVNEYLSEEIDVDEVSRKFGLDEPDQPDEPEQQDRPDEPAQQDQPDELDQPVIDPEMTPAQLADDEEARRASDVFDEVVRNDILGRDGKDIGNQDSGDGTNR